jgi:hypothetical protein
MKIKILYFLPVILGLSLTSCLKDDDFENNRVGLNIGSSPEIVEVLTGGSTTKALSLELSATPTDVNSLVNIALISTQKATEEITVTFDTAGTAQAIREYNTANPSSPLVYLNPALITYPDGLVAKIPAGAKEASLKIKLATATFDPSLRYAIRLGMKTVSPAKYTVSGNNTFIFAIFNAKNKYDGVYETAGTLVDFVTGFTARHPKEIELVTRGANSVIVYENINGAMLPGYVGANGAAGFFYGNWGIIVFFDANDNVTGVRNFYGDPANGGANAVGDPSGGTGAPNYIASNTRRAALDATGINKFTTSGSTKKIDIKYWMIQTNQPTGTGPRSIFTETWTFLRPR